MLVQTLNPAQSINFNLSSVFSNVNGTVWPNSAAVLLRIKNLLTHSLVLPLILMVVVFFNFSLMEFGYLQNNVYVVHNAHLTI